ncbi:hypothetical protein MMC12_007026 [Toensbergia leucococca]|nr:hypothetical protein [Toensbergia leucococca]
MTSKTLLQCLELTTGVQELLLQEHLDGDIDETVLHKILFDLPSLQAVDFCAASSVAFVDAFSSAVTRLNVPLPLKLGIRRLSLHECFTLSSSSLEALLPRLPYLTHLDLYHTRVTNKALESISKTAKVSHLNLGKCTYISGDGLVDFLATHVAVRTLVYLNLCCDISCYRLLWEFDVDRLLPLLPSTLRSLNLNGAKVRPSHVPLLLPLTKHLEELSLGSADLSMRDINSLFLPKPESVTDVDSALSHEETKWVPSTLCYLDLSGIASISQSSIFSSSCVLLGSMTSPLEVLELGDKAISSLRECKNTNKMVGWVVKECGRRGWYVREPLTDAPGGKSGRRNWKMGAVWWGMRKIPVAWGEVAGLYGHYMFKK